MSEEFCLSAFHGSPATIGNATECLSALPARLRPRQAPPFPWKPGGQSLNANSTSKRLQTCSRGFSQEDDPDPPPNTPPPPPDHVSSHVSSMLPRLRRALPSPPNPRGRTRRAPSSPWKTFVPLNRRSRRRRRRSAHRNERLAGTLRRFSAAALYRRFQKPVQNPLHPSRKCQNSMSKLASGLK